MKHCKLASRLEVIAENCAYKCYIVLLSVVGEMMLWIKSDTFNLGNIVIL